MLTYITIIWMYYFNYFLIIYRYQNLIFVMVLEIFKIYFVCNVDKEYYSFYSFRIFTYIFS